MAEPKGKGKSSYTSDDITKLSNLDAVRQRTGMYIGGIGKSNMHHLINEIVNNSVDEIVEGHGDTINIHLRKDGFIEIEDNGRGIPVAINKDTGMAAVRMVFEDLHAGGKFGNKNYAASGGLNGVGASVTNFLSEELTVFIKRSGHLWKLHYIEGVVQGDVADMGPLENKKETGTKVIFKPTAEIFADTTFDFEHIKKFIEEQSYLIPQCKIILSEEDGESFEFHGKTIKDLLDKRNKAKNIISPVVEGNGNKEVISKRGKNEVKKALYFNYAVQVVASDETRFTSFVNNVGTSNGGHHVKGLEYGFKKGIEKFAQAKKIRITSEKTKLQDFTKGLSGVISINYSEPEFVGQTKDELGSSEVRVPIQNAFAEVLFDFCMNNPKEAKKLIAKVKSNISLRKKIEEAKNNAVKSVSSIGIGIPGKLKHCQSKKPEECELFLVEWDSAAWSWIMARNSRTQAILSLKGKVINAFTANPAKLLANKEVQSIINALGCGYLDTFDISKLRYNKVIIFTDLDSDGYHISALLTTLFFELMPELILNGHLYKAKGPLYAFSVNNKKIYVDTEQEKDKVKAKLDAEGKKYKIGRYKGLGEMNPDELGETMMDPFKRKLQKVTVDDIEEVKQYIERVMGDDTDLKFELTQNFGIDSI